MLFKEAVLRWFSDLSAQGILITDAELKIRGWNHWLENCSGLSADEVLGRGLLELYPELVTRRLDEYFKDALAGQARIISQRLHGYLLAMTPPPDTGFAQMQQSARIAPLIEQDRVIGTITVIDDVTERVESEDNLVRLLASERAAHARAAAAQQRINEALEREQAARAEAEAANRAKDEFLATVSHELRTPLNAILGWVQILSARRFDQNLLTRAIGAVERNAKAQAKIIEDILDVSRIITGNLRLDVNRVEVAAIIRAAIDAVRPAATAKAIQISLHLDAAPEVCADPNRLQQVVWNLLSNAIKFTPAEGRVEVRLGTEGSQAQITITDTGQGISPDFLPYVFERFRQADSTSARVHGGLGLGLAIVRHLVEMHGGSVQASSEGRGRGATFIVRLPIAIEVKNECDQPPRKSSEAEPVLDGLRILVVDDEPDARDMLNVMLSQSGAEVKVSATVGEALTTVEQWHPDVLVSDVGMPGEDGYMLINKIRALGAERGGMIPAVALTGYARKEDRLRLLDSGFQAHLAKPVELNELVEVVASLVGRARQNVHA
jgi:signal transduction histidine kinase/ActR/RegA family two-component response regulator